MIKVYIRETGCTVQFDSKEQRDLFVAQFPKSMAVKVNDSSAWAIEWSAGTNYSDNYENYLIYYYHASIHVSTVKTMSGKINKVTGSTNEQGLKRLTRFYKAIEAEMNK